MTNEVEHPKGGDEDCARNNDHTQCVRTDPWTKTNSIATAALVIATVISDVFLYRTEITISKQLLTNQLQLRAYIYVVPEIPTLIDGKDNTGTIQVKNGGQTPAYYVNGNVHMGGFTGINTPDEESLAKETTHKHVDFSRMTIAPQPDSLVISIDSKWVLNSSPSDRARFRNGLDQRFYYWGNIKYKDIFSCIHNVKFCFIYYGESLSANGPSPEECPGRPYIDTADSCEKDTN